MSETLDFLNAHQPAFSKCVDLISTVVAEMVAEGIITGEEKEEILAETTTPKKVDILFRLLRTRSSATIALIAPILRKNLQEEAAKIFDNFSNAPGTSVIQAPFSHEPKILKGAAKEDRIEFKVSACIESFTGRSAILDQLHKIIEGNRQSGKLSPVSQISVISGMGGVGKSETVRRYIQLHKGSYHHIIWIAAETVPEVQSSFRQLATILGLPLPNHGSESAEFIIEEVYNFLCQKSTLIIFDNAERLESEGKYFGIRSYIPLSLKHGWLPPAILVTSRNKKWHPVNERSCIELSGLEDDECVELLTTQLAISNMEEDQNAAQQINMLCDRLPLMVQQVIAFIKQERETADVLGKPAFTMADFISSYEERKEELLKTRPDESPAGESVFVIFQLTFAKIASNKQIGALAIKYLRKMSYLPPDNIPKLLLTNILDNKANEANVTESLKLLQQFNLLSSVGTNFRIHRMIQEVALQTQRLCIGTMLWVWKKEIVLSDVLILELLTHFTRFLVEMPVNGSDNNYYDILQCAALFILRLSKDLLSSSTCKLFCDKLVEHLERNYLMELLILVSEAIVEMAGSEVELIKLKQLLASSYNNNGRYADALTLYQDVLSFQSQQYGVESDQALELQRLISIVLFNQGKYAEVLAMRKSIEEIRTRVLGNTHPKTTVARTDVARVLFQQLEYNETLVLLNDLLQVSVSSQDPNDHMILEIERLLGQTLFCLDRFGESSDLWNRLIPKFEKRFGVGHFEVWAVKYQLALSYLSTDRIEDAHVIISEYVNVLPRFFSKNHPHILIAQSCLALTLSKGKFDEAMEIVQNIEPKVNASAATDYVTFSDFYTNLGAIFIFAEKFSEAESAYRHAITVLEEILPVEHPAIIRIKSLLHDVTERSQSTVNGNLT